MVEDTLARVETLGMSDRDIERGAQLPAGFMTKSRNGNNRNARAAVSWGKLRAWLATIGGPAAKGVKGGGEIPAAKKPGELGEEDASLAEEIGGLKTMRACGACLVRIAVAVAEDRLDIRKAETLEKLITRRMKALKEERAEKAVKQVRALEVLTPAEAELLRKHREALAGPPLLPGQAVPAPDEATE